jgi:uncharacterized protein (TIGR03435 family)
MPGTAQNIQFIGYSQDMKLALLAMLLFQSGLDPSFEVVSVKPSAPTLHHLPPKWSGGPGMPDSTTMVCSTCPLTALVMGAFGAVQRYQIAGPDWLDSDLVDFAAKVPPNTTREQIGPMLRGMLQQYFHMATHRETREMTVAELVQAKGGAKLKPTPAAQACDLHGPEDTDAACAVFSYTETGFSFKGIAPMKTLVSALSMQQGKAVTDATGLTGQYKFNLAFVPDGVTETEFGVPLDKALPSQLGLRLESKKGPVDMVVIDHIDRDPTGN